jgi:hypothetical protein
MPLYTGVQTCRRIGFERASPPYAIQFTAAVTRTQLRQPIQTLLVFVRCASANAVSFGSRREIQIDGVGGISRISNSQGCITGLRTPSESGCFAASRGYTSTANIMAKAGKTAWLLLQSLGC